MERKENRGHSRYYRTYRLKVGVYPCNRLNHIECSLKDRIGPVWIEHGSPAKELGPKLGKSLKNTKQGNVQRWTSASWQQSTRRIRDKSQKIGGPMRNVWWLIVFKMSKEAGTLLVMITTKPLHK